MNIGLIGYGKMGKEVETVARQRSHSIAAIADVDANLSEMESQFRKCDAIVDFSVPTAVLDHIRFAATVSKPIVIGTTGWQKEMEEAKNIVNSSGIAAVASSNFSLGMNLFISTVERAAKLFGQYDGFDCAVLESHHNQKADAPSGTAISIGNAILENFPSKKKTRAGIPVGRIPKDELQINSIRIGNEFGTHSVFFDSENDRIELTHTSRGRRGFALGAVIAAEWSVGKKGFHLFKDILSEQNRGRNEG
ncbi:MAG TPA: 4-hydroxy-tetrahydrodipicolinate reductase [Candidatus Kryptonia bacterium]